jgi:hypothetical protein
MAYGDGGIEDKVSLRWPPTSVVRKTFSYVKKIQAVVLINGNKKKISGMVLDPVTDFHSLCCIPYFHETHYR